MKIIKNRQICADDWQYVADGEPLPEGNVFVSLQRFRRDKALLAQRAGKCGVRLKSDETAHEIKDDLAQVAAVALEFPKFSDGRGYSTARLLRDRYAYSGEIRAVGAVLRDQMFYMHRCGVDAFEVQPGKDVEEALSAFQDFSVTYQGAADDPRPLFRRR